MTAALSLALASHELVTAGWRVLRPDGEGDWLATPVDHWRCHRGCPCRTFVQLGDALAFAISCGTIEQPEPCGNHTYEARASTRRLAAEPGVCWHPPTDAHAGFCHVIGEPAVAS